jgi:hypothetical protein
MVALGIIIVMLSLLTAVGGALIALRIQYGVLDRTHQEREAWQKAQESRQRTWEVRQGKNILDIEKKLGEQVKEMRKDFRDLSFRVEENQQVTRVLFDLERELVRLPHVEDVELPFNQYAPRQQPERWQPPAWYGVDLHGRDLSYRYMGRADLRDATLTEANLSMADLSGASLSDANLECSNLVGTNFSGADLRGANLSGANLLVADLHNAILHGAILQNTLNLTLEQLQTSIYDSTTVIDLTLTSSTVVSTSVSELPEPSASTQEIEQPANIPEIPVSAKKPENETDQKTDGEADLGEETEKMQALPARKIIQLPARTAKAELSSSTEPKHNTKGSRGRSKRKKASNPKKISSIPRDEDKQVQAK